MSTYNNIIYMPRGYTCMNNTKVISVITCYMAMFFMYYDRTHMCGWCLCDCILIV